MRTLSPAISAASPVLGRADIAYQVATTFAELAAIIREWDSFVESCHGDIYMSYDWCRIWWEHYGDGRQLRIYLFRRGEQLVGILPMCIERIWLGPIWLRVGKLVGADSSLTLCDPPVRPSQAEAVFGMLIDDLIGGGRCDAVAFGPLSGGCESDAAIRIVCFAKRSLARLARDIESGVHTLFKLPESFDEYIASLSKSQRGNYRRQTKLLRAAHKIDSEVITDPEQGITSFAALRTMHDAQWNALGKAGHFCDWPNSIAFNAALVRRMAELGRLRIVRISADGQPISLQYCYRFGGRMSWRLPARATGADWDRIGLGGLSIATKIQLAISEGTTEIEAGIGHYDYKLQWGGTEHSLRSILITSTRSGAKTRAYLFVRLADLLHLLYYRIWFLKVAPKLRVRPGPLWQIWIRSRL